MLSANILAFCVYAVWVYENHPHAINFFDYFDFFASVVGRCIVISTKYGSYGHQLMKLVRGTTLDDDFLDSM